MDFFNMNFSELFEEKHGKQLFNDIRKQILLESSNANSKDYIELIFKVAFFDYLGLTEDIMEILIKDIMGNQCINIKEIKVVHKKSIKEIQEHLQISIDTEKK